MSTTDNPAESAQRAMHEKEEQLLKLLQEISEATKNVVDAPDRAFPNIARRIVKATRMMSMIG